MDKRLFDTYDLMCRTVADEIVRDLAANPRQMLCIAAGHTSLGVFKCLIEDYKGKKIDFSQAYFVAMDEWLNMSEKTTESCGYFLVENFLKHVNYPQENIRLWDGTTAAPESECTSVEAFIKENAVNGVIDYLVLGSGMNGHLALNEPGTSFTSRAHTTALDPITQKVGQKYFSDGAALTGGITLGLGNFGEARRKVLMINGTRKAQILGQILNTAQATENLPASAMLIYDHAALYYDREALEGE